MIGRGNNKRTQWYTVQRLRSAWSNGEQSWNHSKQVSPEIVNPKQGLNHVLFKSRISELNQIKVDLHFFFSFLENQHWEASYEKRLSRKYLCLLYHPCKKQIITELGVMFTNRKLRFKRFFSNYFFMLQQQQLFL